MNILSNEESQTTRSYSYIQKIQLKNDIEKNLEQKELTEILKILVENNIKLSQNYTGVLFDLKYVPNDILEKIEKYVNFCSENRKNQIENDTLKSEYKKQLKPDTYKYEASIEHKTVPLSNLYQKYKNVNDNKSVEVPTYNIQENPSIYKVNISIGNKKSKKSKNKNEYKNNIKFNELTDKKESIDIDIDIDNLDDEKDEIDDEIDEINEIDEIDDEIDGDEEESEESEESDE